MCCLAPNVHKFAQIEYLAFSFFYRGFCLGTCYLPGKLSITLPRASTQNTTTPHNNQHELLPPYPPSSFALYLYQHGNIHHDHRSWHRHSLWVYCIGGWSWSNKRQAILPTILPLQILPKIDVIFFVF
jgi:hypothetical protein